MIILSALGLPELGGGAGIGVAALYGLQQLVAYLNGRKTNEITEEGVHASTISSAVADAATANAVILRVNESLHLEVERLGGVNNSLRQQITEKDRIITETQAEVERLMGKMAELYATLEELKSK
jgi:peptidoglycan hydrolase CwlO-like protein